MLFLLFTNLIKLTGTICPRQYVLLKTDKNGVLLRPKLYMIGSSQQKWLVTILQLTQKLYNFFCIKYSSSFSGFIQNYHSSAKFMYSFDVSSIFTCVILMETSDICTGVSLPPFRRIFSYDWWNSRQCLLNLFSMVLSTGTLTGCLWVVLLNWC